MNDKIKINNNIFRGCTSLLIIPNISKWNINLPECFDSSLGSIYSIKPVKTDSVISENIIQSSNLSNNSSPSKYINNILLDENNYNLLNSKNEDLDDYYENFYDSS